MNKKLKRISKISVAVFVVVAIMISCLTPLINVFAESHGTGSSYITMGLGNDLGFTIDDVTINNDAWVDGDEYHSDNHQYHIEINVSGNETTGDTVPALQWGGNWNDYVLHYSHHTTDNGYQFVLDLNNTTSDTFVGLSIVEDNDDYNAGPEPGQGYFDGNAVVVWSCGTGTCYHHFTNIPAFDDGNSTFYRENEVEADNKPGTYFDVYAEYKGWYLFGTFDFWIETYRVAHEVEGSIDWDTVDPEEILGDPVDMREWESRAIEADVCPNENLEMERCVDMYYASQGTTHTMKLQPVGEPTYKNAYVSYGDRNFKVAIYNEEYKGVTIGSLDDLDYYPAEWTNAFIRRDHFDISGTTKSNPTGINTILLEDEVNIKALPYNSYEIKSIEALDVPEGAVTITKVGDEFKLLFSSNFYDNVVFKVTDTDNEVSYMQVKRTTIDGYLQHVEDNKLALGADFYFDREKSYQDFIITAKIYYYDGTTKNVTLEAQRGIDDGLMNIADVYEVDEENSEFGPAGKGLKKSYFRVILDGDTEESIDKVYLNAEYTGSTESNYAGAYVGSGEGVLANIYKPDEEEGE